MDIEKIKEKTTKKRTKELKELRAKLDSKQFPETVSYLKEVENDSLPAIELAGGIQDCDRDRDFSPELFEYVKKLYDEEIKLGNPDAYNDLGTLYYVGRGCEQSFKEAYEYYEKAAKLGCRVAQENLGYCYYYGRDMPVDYEKAFHYFALGAFDGHLISLYKIGDMYLNGYYVEKNPTEAINIYRRCLETMDDESAKIVAGPVYLRYGKALLDGVGVDEDPKFALWCFQRAEMFLYDMVENGDFMYKRSLKEAKEGQEKARKKLDAALPEKDWGHN